MYGQIHDIVKELVLEKFGAEAWGKICKEAGYDDLANEILKVYPDDATVHVIVTAAKTLGVEVDTVLEVFGDYFIDYLEKNGSLDIIRILGSSLYEFIRNLDTLHVHLENTYENASFPHFNCSVSHDGPENSGSIHLSYLSSRGTLLAPIVIGLIKKVAVFFFDTPVDVIKINDIEGDTGCIFKVSLTEEALQAKKYIIPRRKRMASVSRLKKGDSSETPITAEMLLDEFHHFIVITDKGKIQSLGNSWMNEEIDVGRDLSEFFTFERPISTFDFEHLEEYSNNVFVMTFKPSGMVVQGAWKMIPTATDDPEETRFCLFLGGPRPKSLHEMLKLGLKLSDIAVHDATRDLIFMMEQNNADQERVAIMDGLRAEAAMANRRADTVLENMLPKMVMQKLKNGERVPPTSYEATTVLFTDIVGFTAICSTLQPAQVCDMLDELYVCFDVISTFFNVYKVETIGDAYMIIGGAPEEDPNHAYEVCLMGHALLKGASMVKDPSGKHDHLQIRAGINTGPVTAAVCGHRMPRYTILGDTVNTASRMESTAKVLTCHISPTTEVLIRNREGFGIEELPPMPVKGKGDMITYLIHHVDPPGQARIDAACLAAESAIRDLKTSKQGSDGGSRWKGTMAMATSGKSSRRGSDAGPKCPFSAGAVKKNMTPAAEQDEGSNATKSVAREGRLLNRNQIDNK